MNTKIIIRQSVRKEIADIIPSLLTVALLWMQKKYPDVSFERVEYIFSAGFNGSSHFRNKNSEKYKNPVVCISTRATIFLYKMKTLNIKKYKVFSGSKIQIETAMIHELTHHVQYEKELNKGELLTTANELEYLKENYIDIYNKIMGIKKQMP